MTSSHFQRNLLTPQSPLTQTLPQLMCSAPAVSHYDLRKVKGPSDASLAYYSAAGPFAYDRTRLVSQMLYFAKDVGAATISTPSAREISWAKGE